MNESEIRRAIDEALKDARVMDPHCHMDSSSPMAQTHADIVLYHHVWIELISAGMGQRETNLTGLPHEMVNPGLDPAERVRRALPFLPRIRNSTVHMMLRWLLEDVYGFREELTAASAERLEEAVAARAKEAGWQERFFDRVCGIERCITVEGRQPGSGTRFEWASEALRCINIVDGKRPPRVALADMGRMLGREVKDAADYCETLKKVIDRLPIKQLKFLGIWALPDMNPQYATDKDVTRIIGQAREGIALSPEELGSVTYFGFTRSLEMLRATPLRTIQLIAGAEAYPPHRSVTDWSGAFSDAAARIAGQFEDFHFNMSAASEVFIHDMAILAKHFPNMSVAGYWWHTFYPGLIRKAIEYRLDTVPMGKIVGFFSDAYHAEWCYPKLKLVKQILSDVLTERVQRSWYSLDDARTIIQALLHDAPKDIYHMGT